MYQEASLNMPAVAFPHDSSQPVHYGTEPEEMLFWVNAEAN
jgi:hypothetical protein